MKEEDNTHPHFELECKWLNNKSIKIQYRDSKNGGIWHDTTAPSWAEWLDYREKPEDDEYEQATVAQAEEQIEPPKPTGPKYDQDPYDKPRLSLVPWEILSANYQDGDIRNIAYQAHCILNNTTDGTVSGVFKYTLGVIGAKPLAVALGYGVSKYWHESWKEGFGGDWGRFLEATLRHCDAVLHGEEYDGEVVEGYPRGNLHLGAIVFSLMVADQEVEK